MMRLVSVFQPAKNRQRVLDARLGDRNRLEPSFERRVFFDIFAVLVERRRADALHFAARKRRFQEVCGVGAPLRVPRSDDGV